MRKISFPVMILAALFLVVASSALVSCDKTEPEDIVVPPGDDSGEDPDNPDTPDIPEGEESYTDEDGTVWYRLLPADASSGGKGTVEAEAELTKAYISSATPTWKVGDTLALLSDEDDVHYYSASCSNAAKPYFQGGIPTGGHVYAISPRTPAGLSVTGSRDARVFKYTIPTVQYAGVNGIDESLFVTMGYRESALTGSDNRIKFYNTCAVVRVKVNQDDITAITIVGNARESLSNVDVTISDLHTGSPIAAVSGSAPRQYATMCCKDANGSVCAFTSGREYYMVLPPVGALSEGFSVYFTVGKTTDPLDGLSVERHTVKSGSSLSRNGGINLGQVDMTKTSSPTCYMVVNRHTMNLWAASYTSSAMRVAADVNMKDGFDIFSTDSHVSDAWQYPNLSVTGSVNGLRHGTPGTDADFNRIYNLVVNLAETDNGVAMRGFIGTLNGSISNLIFGSSGGSAYDNASSITVTGVEYGAVGIVGNLIGSNSVSYVESYIPVSVTAGTETSPGSYRIHVGGIVGYTEGDATTPTSISHCTNRSAILLDGNRGGTTRSRYCSVGGVLGTADGDSSGATKINVSDNANHGTVTLRNTYHNVDNETAGTAGSAAGGVIGKLCHYINTRFNTSSSISGNSNSGSVRITGSMYGVDNIGQYFSIGGVVGYIGNANSITFSGNNNNSGGSVSVDDTEVSRLYCGGIIGYSHGRISIASCTNRGSLTGTNTLTSHVYEMYGGLVGYSTGNSYSEDCISGSSNHGNISVSSNMSSEEGSNSRMAIGGITGRSNKGYYGYGRSSLFTANSGNITVSVTGDGRNECSVGGILGNCRTLADAYANNDASYLSNRVNFYYLQNTGTITVNGTFNNLYVAGIVSLAQTYNSVIQNCKNGGNITVGGTSLTVNDSARLGGIVGTDTAAAVTNCANTATISGKGKAQYYWIGGIAGRLTYRNDKLDESTTYVSTSSATGCSNTGEIKDNGIQASSWTGIGGIAGGASGKNSSYKVTIESCKTGVSSSSMCPITVKHSTTAHPDTSNEGDNLQGRLCVGGIIGSQEKNVTVGANGKNVYSYANICAEGNFTPSSSATPATNSCGRNWIGGIVGVMPCSGETNSSVSYCNFAGKISQSANIRGEIYMTGIVGGTYSQYNSETISDYTVSNCTTESSSSIVIDNQSGHYYFFLSGIINDPGGTTISDCTNNMPITAKDADALYRVAGIAASHGGTPVTCKADVSGCSNTAALKVEDSYTDGDGVVLVGGIFSCMNSAGTYLTSCSSCSNTGAISYTSSSSNTRGYVGGIVAQFFNDTADAVANFKGCTANATITNAATTTNNTGVIIGRATSSSYTFIVGDNTTADKVKVGGEHVKQGTTTDVSKASDKAIFCGANSGKMTYFVK